MAGRLYLKFKALMPEPLRDILSVFNQRLFARRTIRKKLGPWFEVDFRKKRPTFTAHDWRRLYEACWRHTVNACLSEGDGRRIRDAVGRSCSVLDIGCGTGRLALSLAQSDCRVTALDLSLEALRLARDHIVRSGVDISLVEGFAEYLPFPSSAFDCITCCHTLEHVNDLDRTVAEFKRVAKEKIVILVPKQKYRLYAENYHTYFFNTPEQLADAFNLERFQCVEIDGDQGDSGYSGPMLLYVGHVNP